MSSPSTNDPGTGPVVVAIDDSDSSRAALAWAVAYARDVHAELQVVHVLRYDFGDPVTWAPGLLGAPHTVPAGALDANKHLLHQLYLATRPEPGWSLRFLDGPAGHAIVDAAQDARLLVLGTRGHRGLERLLVGSVSHYCLAHAACPVVAVPAPTTTAASPDEIAVPLSIAALP
jgi:nucleotide-binding universal stress UspA family protein